MRGKGDEAAVLARLRACLERAVASNVRLTDTALIAGAQVGRTTFHDHLALNPGLAHAIEAAREEQARCTRGERPPRKPWAD